MIVRHMGYSYFDGDSDDQKEYNENEMTDETFYFNPDKFQKYIDKKEYEEAYKYADKFVFDDPRKQQEFRNQLELMRSEGRRVSAIYSKLKDSPDKMQAVEFAENVFIDGGLETIGDNKYAKRFIDAKKAIGSTSDKEATALSVTFAKKEQVGLFGWDWIEPDNPYDITNFYERTGLNEQMLKVNGITPVIEKDGSTTLKFDKTNPLANKIIANIYSPELLREESPSTYYFGTFNPAKAYSFKYRPNVKGYDTDGNEISKNLNTYDTTGPLDVLTNATLQGESYLRQMQRAIYDASQERDKTFAEMQMADKVYSSTITGHLDDGWYKLQKDYAEGKIDYTTYNKMLSSQQKELADFISSIGTANYEIYSNQNNEAINDEVLSLMNPEDKGAALRHISACSGDIMIKGMISNGKIGVLVTVPASKTKEKDIKEDDTADDRTIGRRFQYFIPGLLTEKVQAAVNKNTSSRSAGEINKMQDWGYAYTTQDGQSIIPDGTGTFIYSGADRPLSTEEVRKIIDKDMMLIDMKNNFTFNFVNNKNKGFNADSYQEQAQEFAYKAVQELYPEVPFLDKDNKQLSIDDLFAIKGFGLSMSEDAELNMSAALYDKIMQMYDMYDKIMSNITYYFK